MTSLRLRVAIVTHGRPDCLRACWESVERALPENAEVLVLVNGPDPQTVRYLSSLKSKRLSWRQIARESRCRARNRALEVAHDIDVIHWLDDDVVVPPHLFRDTLARFERDPGLAIVGGPNLTPPDSSPLEKIFGAVMTSGFAAPFVRSRYGATGRADFVASEHDLILCSLAIRREAIPAGVRFRDGLMSNEENLLLYQCHRLGLRAVHAPSLYVHHRRRKTISSFTRQVYSYGFGRAQQTREAPQSLHPAFLVPSLALLAGFAIALGVAPFDTGLFLLLTHAMGSALGAAASREARALGWRIVLLVPLTGLVHVAYGVGLWHGFVTGGLPELEPSQVAGSKMPC